MGVSKAAAVLALALALVAPAAWPDERTLHVSAIVLSKCSLGGTHADPAAGAPAPSAPGQLRCTGSDVTVKRVSAASDTPAGKSAGNTVVTIEF